MFKAAKVQHAFLRTKNLANKALFPRHFNSAQFPNIEDDGYTHNAKPSIWGNVISKFASRLQPPPKPGNLILVRHGETEWNHKKLFTGWVDVDLSERGCQEIEHAARLLLERGYKVDITYTSVLKRAIRSSWIILDEINQIYRPIIKSWRLNERMYGALEGHSKPGLAKVYGEQQVQKWRGGLHDRPPEMTIDHLYYHGKETKYAQLDPTLIPLTESLQDCLDRTIPLWNSQILPDLKAGRNVLIVAHRNSIRGIVKHIDNISMENIQRVGIPNGIPLVYKFDQDMKPVQDKGSVAPLSGVWLEKQGHLRAALAKEQAYAESIPGFLYNSNSITNSSNSSLTPSSVSSGNSVSGGAGNAAGSVPSSANNESNVKNISVTLSTARHGLNMIANNNNAALIKSLSKLKEQRKLYEEDHHSVYSGGIDNHSQPFDLYLKPNPATPASTSTLTTSTSTSEDSSVAEMPIENYTYNDMESHGGDILSFAELYRDDKILQSVYETQQLKAHTMEGFNVPGIGTSGGLNLSTTTKAGAVPAVGVKNTEYGSASDGGPLYTIDGSKASLDTKTSQSAPAAPVKRVVTITPEDICEELIKLKKNGGYTSTSTLSTGDEDDDDDVLQRPLLVIIRHGKTAHNQLGLFTGWEDAPLTDTGREEALHAGKLFKQHGLTIDVIYTSWLSRAIETAWIVMNELDVLWLPIVKSWRLNERMYGALTGLSKKMIQQIYGDEQFKKWRRGFNEPPPEISSFSAFYPGNDNRYQSYVQDVEISLFETAVRSLANGRFEVHRKFPKSESLKDCMERTVPYFLNTIVPESIKPGKNVLISSSENAIRGLLMHLCDIPQDKIHAVEIPTGLPLIYDSKHKRIRLLDDNDSRNMLTRYNFGANPDLLFKRSGSQNREPNAPHVENMDLSEVLIRNNNGGGGSSTRTD